MSSQRSAMTRARLKQKTRAISIKYATEELRKDRKVVITAMLNHPGALVYCLDEDLKAELQGLSRPQLQALLETADEDMLPPQPTEFYDDDFGNFDASSSDGRAGNNLRAINGDGEFLGQPTCLMCFDAGQLCVSCTAARQSAQSSVSSTALQRTQLAFNSTAADPDIDSDATEKSHAFNFTGSSNDEGVPTKKKKNKKKKQGAAQITTASPFLAADQNGKVALAVETTSILAGRMNTEKVSRLDTKTNAAIGCELSDAEYDDKNAELIAEMTLEEKHKATTNTNIEIYTIKFAHQRLSDAFGNASSHAKAPSSPMEGTCSERILLVGSEFRLCDKDTVALALGFLTPVGGLLEIVLVGNDNTPNGVVAVDSSGEQENRCDGTTTHAHVKVEYSSFHTLELLSDEHSAASRQLGLVICFGHGAADKLEDTVTWCAELGARAHCPVVFTANALGPSGATLAHLKRCTIPMAKASAAEATTVPAAGPLSVTLIWPPELIPLPNADRCGSVIDTGIELSKGAELAWFCALPSRSTDTSALQSASRVQNVASSTTDDAVLMGKSLVGKMDKLKKCESVEASITSLETQGAFGVETEIRATVEGVSVHNCPAEDCSRSNESQNTSRSSYGTASTLLPEPKLTLDGVSLP